MIREAAALFMLLGAAGAAAQDGAGIVVTSGNPGFTFETAPTFVPDDFQLIFHHSITARFVIVDFNSMVTAATRPPERFEPVSIDRSTFDEQPLVGVEGDGVRLPDERLDTVKR